MTIADDARAAALPCEMVKYALRQSKDGVVVSFVVHPNDIPAALQTARIGSRWMGALVQIGDDELPITRPAKEPSTKPQPLPQAKAGAARSWQDLQPAQQCGIRCGDPTFITFLKEERRDDWHSSTDAAECVRTICGVHSRAELGHNQKARVIWHQLDTEYSAWLAKERVGA